MGTKKATTAGQHSFAKIPSADIQRSVFDRSCGTKTTFDAGALIPVFVDEALPGDTFNLKMHTFARLATPLHPIMDNLYLDSFFFAVPMRLLWDNWQKFNGEQIEPGDSTDYTIPQVNSPGGGWLAGSLADYFGIPTGEGPISHSAMWHRAYSLIWNEWFRDQNLQTPFTRKVDDGPDASGQHFVYPRGKRHDYFTSCLPWPQKGDAVTLPLGTTAPVISAGDGVPKFDITGGTTDLSMKGTVSLTKVDWSASAGASADAIWNDPKLVADLSSATAATINQLRQAFQIQKLYERDARGGSRYVEILRSHFGVTSPDQRLQRPEYLGGGTQIIGIQAVPQTSASDTQPSPQGNLAAYGQSGSSAHGFTKSFVEHCVIMGLVSVRADLNYQQGLNRMFSRLTRWDFYWPALAHIGEQAVLNKEIYMKADANDDLVFGYQERFAEYRYKPSMITGQMRSTHATPLDTWHLAQEFTSLPILGDTFIQDAPPIARIIAVPSEPHFLFDAFFEFKCARPMPTYGVPGLIDHF